VASRGVRRVLQPLLYIGLAGLVHALLFLIPGMGSRPEGGQTRGVRLRVLGEPGMRAPGAPPALEHSPKHVPPQASPPPETAEKTYSSMGGGTPGPGKETTGAPGTEEGGRKGEGGTSERSFQGGSGPPVETEFGSYLARLKSEGVQGWARESASKQRQGWRGTGRAGGSGTGGGGLGTTGGGTGANLGAGGAGTGYLDPRVKMVVTSYPPTGIEMRHTQVPYPDRKIKKQQFTSGWWNVYVQIRIDSTGKVVRREVLRPETNGPLERIFVEQVNQEIDKWSFDRKEAEINVDVRFYVE